MTIKKTIVLLLLFIVSSCKGERIPNDKMPSILAELYVVDRHISMDNTLLLRPDTLMIYEAIFNKYGYTGEQFRETLKFHLERPAKLKELYTKALHIVNQEHQLVAQQIESKDRSALFEMRLKTITADTNAYLFNNAYNRAHRWLAYPNTLPPWNITFSDSLKVLYSTPSMPNWWGDNLDKDDNSLRYIEKNNEKNSRTLPLPSKPVRANQKRPLGFR